MSIAINLLAFIIGHAVIHVGLSVKQNLVARDATKNGLAIEEAKTTTL